MGQQEQGHHTSGLAGRAQLSSVGTCLCIPFLMRREERQEIESPLPLMPWHSWSPERGRACPYSPELPPPTAAWLGPEPKSLMVWPVHLTSVWVVRHTHSSRNLMPSAHASVWRISSWRDRVACLQHRAQQPHDSQAATGDMSPPVPGFGNRRASWSQLHLSRTETMRRDFPLPPLPPHSIPVHPHAGTHPSCFSGARGTLTP